jgi:hypothetical protein
VIKVMRSIKERQETRKAKREVQKSVDKISGDEALHLLVENSRRGIFPSQGVLSIVVVEYLFALLLCLTYMHVYY